MTADFAPLDPDGRFAAMTPGELEYELAQQRRRRARAIQRNDLEGAADAYEQIIQCLAEKIRRGIPMTAN